MLGSITGGVHTGESSPTPRLNFSANTFLGDGKPIVSDSYTVVKLFAVCTGFLQLGYGFCGLLRRLQVYQSGFDVFVSLVFHRNGVEMLEPSIKRGYFFVHVGFPFFTRGSWRAVCVWQPLNPGDRNAGVPLPASRAHP